MALHCGHLKFVRKWNSHNFASVWVSGSLHEIVPHVSLESSQVVDVSLKSVESLIFGFTMAPMGFPGGCVTDIKDFTLGLIRLDMFTHFSRPLCISAQSPEDGSRLPWLRISCHDDSRICCGLVVSKGR